jgi:hypothetical protein
LTISAVDRANDSDRLERALELYRDLTVALRDRITLLKAGTEGEKVRKELGGDVKQLEGVIGTVIGIEERLGKRRNAWGGVELDLDAARAEIAQRLAVRAAEG